VALSGNKAVASWIWRRKAQLASWAAEKTTPARAALGFAAGAFLGMFPTFNIGSLLAWHLASRLKLHQGAALSATFLKNSLTSPLLYAISYAVGVVFVGAPSTIAHGDFSSRLGQLSWAFLLGNTIVAFLTATFLGLGVFFWMRREQSRIASGKHALDSRAAAFPA
jgi:uncharacterized protein (DUF2062 family)